MRTLAQLAVLAFCSLVLSACGADVVASTPVDPILEQAPSSDGSARPGDGRAPANVGGEQTAADTRTAAASGVATVTKIVDGDTIDVELGARTERVRLIGIDTPESVKPNEPVECFGVEASHHLAELLPLGSEVELVRDVELRDAYDRLLAYVFRRDDGLFVNLAMAADGYAGTLTFPPNVTFAEDLRAAVTAARLAGLGLWSGCTDPDSLFR